MWNKFKFVICLSIILIVFSCESQLAKVESLVSNEGYRVDYNFKEFENMPKSTIPVLISVIDKQERGIVGIMDTLSSRLYPIDNYVGIRAAYAIEYMLAGSEQMQQFSRSVIGKVNSGDPVYEALSLSDMREIKALYEQWWENSKHKSLTELKKGWSINKPILQSSKFQWY